MQVGITSWGGVSRSWVGDVGAARSWIAGIVGLARGGDDILVVGSSTEDHGPNLVAGLQAAGYTVTTSWPVPEDMSPYAAIFDVDGWFGYDPDDVERLANFVRSGGGLLLTGEWGLGV